MIKVDYNQAPVFEEFKSGYYEVIVAEAKPQTASTGKKMIVFSYKVRDDIDQGMKNKSINFDRFVINEESEYFASFFNQRSQGYGIPNGVAFDTYEEWAQSVVGNPVRLKVEAVQNGQYVNANVKGWYPTQTPLDGSTQKNNNTRVDQDPFSKNSGPIEITDEDLPF